MPGHREARNSPAAQTCEATTRAQDARRIEQTVTIQVNTCQTSTGCCPNAQASAKVLTNRCLQDPAPARMTRAVLCRKSATRSRCELKP
eukprot:1653245-Amphidinium_carterae.1